MKIRAQKDFNAGLMFILIGAAFLIIAAGVPGIVLTVTGRGRQFFSYGPYLVLGALVPLLFPAQFT